MPKDKTTKTHGHSGDVHGKSAEPHGKSADAHTHKSITVVSPDGKASLVPANEWGHYKKLGYTSPDRTDDADADTDTGA